MLKGQVGKLKETDIEHEGQIDKRAIGPIALFFDCQFSIVCH